MNLMSLFSSRDHCLMKQIFSTQDLMLVSPTLLSKVTNNLIITVISVYQTPHCRPHPSAQPLCSGEALQVLVHVLKPPKLLSYSDYLLAALHLQRVPVGEETPAKPQVEREPRDIAAKTLLDTHFCLVIPRRRTRGNLEEENDEGAVIELV